MCWYCHWGLPKPVADIYLEAVEKLHGNEWPLHFGPSHTVWEDYNLDSAQWCLDHFEEYKGEYSEEELEIVKWSLEQLARLSPELYDFDVDYENFENSPPPEGVIMVKV